MTTVNAVNYVDNGAGFDNELSYTKLVYDFAGGDIGGIADVVKLGKFSDKVIMKQAIVRVATAVTSDGSATIDVGFTGGDTDFFVAAKAPAALTADAIIAETTNIPVVIAADTEIQLSVATAALTAGKVELHIWYRKA